MRSIMVILRIAMLLSINFVTGVVIEYGFQALLSQFYKKKKC